jgi:hypothetical protein
MQEQLLRLESMVAGESPSTIHSQKLLWLKDISEITGIPINTLRKTSRSGNPPLKKKGGKLCIHIDDLNEWMESSDEDDSTYRY